MSGALILFIKLIETAKLLLLKVLAEVAQFAASVADFRASMTQDAVS
jgi:hypothetical protein